MILSHTRCAQKNFVIIHLLLIFCILNTVHFKVVSSTGDTPLPTFLPLLQSFLEPTLCDGAQYAFRNSLYLVFGLEMTSFQICFNIWKRDKFCWG